ETRLPGGIGRVRIRAKVVVEGDVLLKDDHHMLDALLPLTIRSTVSEHAKWAYQHRTDERRRDDHGRSDDHWTLQPHDDPSSSVEQHPTLRAEARMAD